MTTTPYRSTGQEAADGRASIAGMTFPCVCCGHLTLHEPPGSYQICPVCFWEDDIEQLRWPDWPAGVNKLSLLEAHRNYRQLGACDGDHVAQVRAPREDEHADPQWRPIDPEQDQFEPGGVGIVPWPEDPTLLYWWRCPSTRTLAGAAH